MDEKRDMFARAADLDGKLYLLKHWSADARELGAPELVAVFDGARLRTLRDLAKITEAMAGGDEGVG